MNSKLKRVLSSVIVVARTQGRLRLLERITNHLGRRSPRAVASLEEAHTEIMRKVPDAVIIDVSDMDSGQFRAQVEPFVLSLPSWIKTFLIDSNCNPRREKRAIDIGVDGILKSPISHHGMTTLIVGKTPRPGER